VHSRPQVERVRHELRRRRLTVARVQQVAPGMKRFVLRGDDLRGFTSLGFDDHVKLFFPDSSGEVAMRDFTPRRFDPQAGELWIDFFLHEAGPATKWAESAAEGDSLEVGGPKGSAIISTEGIDSHLFVGDETALPAIGRRLEELSDTARAIVVLESDADSVWPTLSSRAALKLVQVARDGRTEPAAHELIDALRKLDLQPERCFAWVALESQSARAIRRHLVEERGFSKEWIKAAAYWRRGAAGTHERIEDEV
jgi:NADPH-dependent ferric siderophore reductase